MHITADRNKEKLNLHLSSRAIWVILFFSYERGHSFVYYTVHVEPGFIKTICYANVECSE